MYVKWTPNDDFDDRRAMAPAKATEYYLFLVELTFAPYISRSRDDAETKMGLAIVLTLPHDGNGEPLE